jgi:formate dehydrogenase (coenzyme F420) beta subunit
LPIGCLTGIRCPMLLPRKIEEVEDLVVGPARYPLEKVAGQIIIFHPEATIGIVARECDQRALNVLSAWNQLGMEKVKTIPCPVALQV